MHSYTTESENREKIHFFLVTTAILTSGCLNFAVEALAPNIEAWFTALGHPIKFSIPVVASFSIWGLLEFAFARWIWRTKLGRALGVKAPNFSGRLVGTGLSSYRDPKTDIPTTFPVVLTVRQNWRSISIEGQFGRSSSHSFAALFEGPDREVPVLVFSYRNSPQFSPDAPSSFKPHEGTCHVWKTDNGFEGTYFTGDGRSTQGKLILQPDIKASTLTEPTPIYSSR